MEGLSGRSAANVGIIGGIRSNRAADSTLVHRRRFILPGRSFVLAFPAVIAPTTQLARPAIYWPVEYNLHGRSV